MQLPTHKYALGVVTTSAVLLSNQKSKTSTGHKCAIQYKMPQHNSYYKLMQEPMPLYTDGSDTKLAYTGYLRSRADNNARETGI